VDLHRALKRDKYDILGLNINALTAVGALMTLIDFILSNAKRFYSSIGNPLAVKGLTESLGSLRGYDDCYNDDFTLKKNFA